MRPACFPSVFSVSSFLGHGTHSISQAHPRMLRKVACLTGVLRCVHTSNYRKRLCTGHTSPGHCVARITEARKILVPCSAAIPVRLADLAACFLALQPGAQGRSSSAPLRESPHRSEQQRLNEDTAGVQITGEAIGLRAIFIPLLYGTKPTISDSKALSQTVDGPSCGVLFCFS
ncbi:hypothetical protein PsYK624_120150 [Phanerochaete sordida]|uniref:Uncharacterized protein n=1 Tax=Phanerochaete sordida TaxID=48140 RepID=A0A9P3GIP2_9APHY|nr:hypothetical protein PsYK624_120150 [Phanerochaete sordida]